MPILPITSLHHPGVEMFTSLTEAQLRNRIDPLQGIFIAESPKVIHVALDAGYTPLALLCEERHITGDAASIIDRCGDIPVYTGKRELLASLTGYTLTRGVLCAMRRPAPPSLETVLRGAQRIVVIDAVLLTPSSCDPLNRRSIRVSMGSTFLVPWTWVAPPLTCLHDYGFTTAAMALSDDSIPLGAPRLHEYERLALIMGTEGDGLSAQTIADSDLVVRIPMSHQVDSLNVAAAAAVAFWELRKRE